MAKFSTKAWKAPKPAPPKKKPVPAPDLGDEVWLFCCCNEDGGRTFITIRHKQSGKTGAVVFYAGKLDMIVGPLSFCPPEVVADGVRFADNLGRARGWATVSA